jgi:hypothetical protein
MRWCTYSASPSESWGIFPVAVRRQVCLLLARGRSLRGVVIAGTGAALSNALFLLDAGMWLQIASFPVYAALIVLVAIEWTPWRRRKERERFLARLDCAAPACPVGRTAPREPSSLPICHGRGRLPTVTRAEGLAQCRRSASRVCLIGAHRSPLGTGTSAHVGATLRQWGNSSAPVARAMNLGRSL